MMKASANSFLENSVTQPCTSLELVCSVASAVDLRAAVDNGADWVRVDYRNDAVHVAGLKFENSGIRKAIRYAHDRRCKLLFGLDRTPGRSWRGLREIVDRAVLSGADALSLSDPALILYVATHYPEVQLHCTVDHERMNREAIRFYRRQLGITRLLLPRSLSLTVLEQLKSDTEIELAVFGFGTLSVIPPGPLVPASARRRARAVFPASHADRLLAEMEHAGAGVDRCATEATPANDHSYDSSAAVDLNVLRVLPRLSAAGVRAIVVESPCHAPVHLAQTTRVWREAIDDCLENVEHYCARPSWLAELYKNAKSTCPEYQHVSV